jgi:hypothetical protein
MIETTGRNRCKRGPQTDKELQMSTATVEIGHDVRRWTTFTVADATPEEVEILQGDDEAAFTLLRQMDAANRLSPAGEHDEDNPDPFSQEHAAAAIIEAELDDEGEAV